VLGIDIDNFSLAFVAPLGTDNNDIGHEFSNSRIWINISNYSLMASQKIRPAALRRFFRTSTYLMYAFAPEKPPGLAGRNFCLAILSKT
jgi:hypothetical protein